MSNVMCDFHVIATPAFCPRRFASQSEAKRSNGGSGGKQSDSEGVRLLRRFACPPIEQNGRRAPRNDTEKRKSHTALMSKSFWIKKGIKERAFTLTELIIVLVIIGVLASIALPRYQVTIEKMRSAEGVNILTALLGAQKRYAAENDGDYTSNRGDLDVTIPASANFNAPTVSASNPIARIRRIDSATSGIDDYTLRITDTGTISCSGGGGGICGKMGY